MHWNLGILHKKIDLAGRTEDPRPVWILTPDEEELLIFTLKDYQDVFAWI